jgi:hypothetical protein
MLAEDLDIIQEREAACRRQDLLEGGTVMSKNWSEVLGISQEAVNLLQRFGVDLDAFYNDPNKERKSKEILESIMTTDSCSAFILYAEFYLCHDHDIRQGLYDIVYRFSRPHEIVKLQQVWLHVPFQAKEFYIRYVFEHNPGEPFKTLENLGHSLRDLKGGPFGPYDRHLPALPLIYLQPIGYIPSMAVCTLRSMVEKAGDSEGLKLIDELIKERRAACSMAGTHEYELRYALSDEEKDLVARLINLAVTSGYQRASLPKIVLSYEPPPLFVTNPELEDTERERDLESNGHSNVPRDAQRPRPEQISIEELLGCYIASDSKIVLWER